MKKVKVEIKGISPLLQHRYADEGKEEKSKKRTGTPNYEDEAEIAAYKLPSGELYQPASHIEGAIVKASTNFRIAGKRTKSYKDLVKSAVFVAPDAIIHQNQKYEIDKRAVIVPSTRGRVIRHRPRIDDWALKFQIEITDDQLDESVLHEILEYAGRNVGIGDYRPRYGRFEITKWEVA